MRTLIMKLLLRAVTIGALTVGSTALFAAEPSTSKAAGAKCSAEQTAANKKLVETTLVKGGPGAIFELIGEDYLQHNPDYVRFAEVNGVNGRDAVKLYEQVLFGPERPDLTPKLAPGQPRDIFPYMVLGDCDIVIVVGKHYHPVADAPGQFYAAYFFNMWRMKDGKLIEHWDPDKLPNPLPAHLKTPVKDLKPAAATTPAKNGKN